jgi:hypothetical protein
MMRFLEDKTFKKYRDLMWYDGSVAWTGVTPEHDRYVGLMVDEREDFRRIYIVARFSWSRYHDFLDGKLAIYKAFKEAEDGHCWYVTEDREGYSTNCQKIECKDLTDHDLPMDKTCKFKKDK